MDRNLQSVLHERRKPHWTAGAIEAVEFFNVLTSPELLQTTEALLPEHRQRLYPPMMTLSMFMRQVLEADGSCQKAVNGWAGQRAADGLSPCSVGTGGYCRARQRLPLEMVSALTRQTGQQLSQKTLAPWLWHGRAVKPSWMAPDCRCPTPRRTRRAIPSPTPKRPGSASLRHDWSW